MTISPVKTRLIRASAFELRSKICGMNAFLLPQESVLVGGLTRCVLAAFL
jgi:hypothetical protein